MESYKWFFATVESPTMDRAYMEIKATNVIEAKQLVRRVIHDDSTILDCIYLCDD